MLTLQKTTATAASANKEALKVSTEISMAFNIDDLINEVAGDSGTTPPVRIADGSSSKAKAESGAYGTAV